MFKRIPISILALKGVKFKYLTLSKEEKMLIIHLDRDKRFGYLCSSCQGPASPKRRGRRQIRDLSFFDKITYLNFEQWEISCPRCGIRVEKLNFVEHYARWTTRLEESIAHLCQYMNLSEVAGYFKLDWKTVKKIDHHYLNRTFKEQDLSELSIIGVDEVAYRKGHKYLTIVFDLVKGKIVWIGENRTKETLDQFFKKLGQKGCENIRSIAMDMWTPYESSTKEYCPQAKIVYDKFHLISAYSKIIDKVRGQEFNKAQEENKEIFKGTKYLLLKNKENLEKDEPQRLEHLLTINHNLQITYILKEQLQSLWNNLTISEMKASLIQWCKLAKESGIKVLEKFVDTLERHQTGILNYCLYPINTAKLEATNNTIGLIRRKAYGFHDQHYFILKIFQAAGFG